MTDTIVIILFCLTMVANVIAFVRHWRMMRVMQIALNSLVETQAEFNRVMDAEQQKRGIDP